MATTSINLDSVNTVNFNGDSSIIQINLKKNNITQVVWQKIIQPADFTPVVRDGYWGRTTLQNPGAGFTSAQQVKSLLEANTGNKQWIYSAYGGFGGRRPINPSNGATIPPSNRGANSYLEAKPDWTVTVANDAYGTQKVTSIKAHTLWVGTYDEDDDYNFGRVAIIGSNNTFYWTWYLTASTAPANGIEGYYVYPNNPGKMPVGGNPVGGYAELKQGAIHVDDYINSIPAVGFAKVHFYAAGATESD